jgi:hypothetical protein
LPQKARDVKKALTRKGFEESKGRDHHVYFLIYNGRKTNIATKISHNCSDINDSLCSIMARQMRLRNLDFNRFVDCSLKLERYIEMLVANAQLDPLEENPQ